jgi:hypothetical protein
MFTMFLGVDYDREFGSLLGEASGILGGDF